MGIIHRHCHDCCNFKRHHTNNKPVTCPNFLGFVIVKLILEVFGAAGAIWGSSDVFKLRTEQPLHSSKSYTTNDFYRLLSLFTFTVFTIRFYGIIKHYLQHNQYEYLPLKMEHRRTHLWTCFEIYASRFVLQVLGGCGAVWGCSEVVGLRRSNSENSNSDSWRIGAACVGCLFLIRWMLQIASYCLIIKPLSNRASSSSSCLAMGMEWFETVVVKVILEVFGAAGAIWGFSQIIMLRIEETVDFWRAVAIVTLVGFTIRWLLNVVLQFARLEGDANKELKSAHRDSNVVSEDDFERRDSEINDLALTETHMLNNSRESSPAPYQSTPQNEDDEDSMVIA